jgi:hypothetical protein
MTRKPFVVLTVAAAVVAGALTACSGGGGRGNGSPSPSPTGNASVQMLDLARRLAQCAREHGHPNFPDPILDQGEPVYPGDAVSKDEATAIAAIPECKPIDEQLSALRTVHLAPTYSAADIQKLKDFAQCLREHGVTEWPDPKADGTFPITGTPLESEGKSQRLITAQQACKQHWDKKIATS